MPVATQYIIGLVAIFGAVSCIDATELPDRVEDAGTVVHRGDGDGDGDVPVIVNGDGDGDQVGDGDGDQVGDGDGDQVGDGDGDQVGDGDGDGDAGATTCELCMTSADCGAGLVCASAEHDNEGENRCLPGCDPGDEEAQEAACGVFGNLNDSVTGRLWLCHDHGACGPLNAHCANRSMFVGRANCVNADYCEGWLAGTL
jgi:hypothetical protein